jgi:phosphate/phosphite/phosphonate ABC transporter binding protein
VLDFGVPAARGAALAAGAPWVRGTLPYAYMSPEQCRGEPLDRRTDVFAAGVVLCELVTGRRIFRRATDALTVRAIAEDAVPDPRTLYPQLPEEIRTVILSALARDRERRYGSAQEMAIAVREALSALGENTSPRTLVSYVEGECADLIAGCRALREGALATGTVDDGSARMEALGRRTRAPTAEGRVRSSRRWLAIAVLAASAVILGTLAGLAFRTVVGSTRPSGPPLRFGLPPAFPAHIGRAEFAGFFRYLEERVGRPVELVVSADYHALRSNLLRGAVDFAQLPPLQLVLAQHAAPELRLLVGVAYERTQTYHGYIVRRIDSPIRDIADLRGKRFCYVDRESTSGYLLPRHYLRTHGLDPDKLFAATRFSGDHTAVLKDVLSGRCDAGASYNGVLLVGNKLGIDAYRLPVLVNTGDLPTDAVCASPTLAPETADALREALLAFDPQKHLGRRTLGRTVFVITRFLPRLPDQSVVREIAKAEHLLDGP